MLAALLLVSSGVWQWLFWVLFVVGYWHWITVCSSRSSRCSIVLGSGEFKGRTNTLGCYCSLRLRKQFVPFGRVPSSCCRGVVCLAWSNILGRCYRSKWELQNLMSLRILHCNAIQCYSVHLARFYVESNWWIFKYYGKSSLKEYLNFIFSKGQCWHCMNMS